MRRSSRGFTLIELMITVAIVAILASVAYPSYRGYILKSKRAEARTAILDLLQQQERFMTQRNSYAPVFAPGATTVSFKTFAGDMPAGAPYLLGTAACDSGAPLTLCVRVVAVPQHADPEAGTLWMESTGEKGCINATRPEVCWP